MPPSPRDGPHPRPRSRRPGTLQRSLLALVLVPVVGLVGLMAYTVDDQADHAAAAAQAADDVHSAVALDGVRAAVTQEVVPVLGRAVLDDADSASSVGVDAAELRPLAALAGQGLDLQLSSVRDTTDEAVARARSTGAARSAATAAATVAGLRADSAAGGDLSAVFAGYQALADDLSAQVSTLLQAAKAEGLDDHGTAALADLQLVSRGAALAGVEVPLFFASTTTGGPDQAHHRAEFLSAWGAAREAAGEVAAQGSPVAVARWSEATGSADAVEVEARLRAAALDGQPLSLAEFAGLAAANGARDAALGAVVTGTGEDAVQAAGEPARAARTTLWLLVAMCLLIVGGSLVAALLLRRWIATPLRRLAEQARAVSDGDLLDVEEGGPLEVRTVARGLAVAVANLRRVRAQAQAVADGALDADVVRRPVHGPLGEVVHASVRQMVSALHERERLQAVLAHQASHDALTELPNRARATELIDASLHRMARHGGRSGLLFVDLDHFKGVNDTHGHAAGDELLRVVSTRMADCLVGGGGVGAGVGAGVGEDAGEGVREGVVARLGGDEFVVVVDEVADQNDLVDLGTRLIDAVSVPVELSGRHTGVRVRVGASVGVALSPPGGCSAERLLLEADAAAYRAKAAGRGTVEVFDDELREDLARRRELAQALRHGLEAGELVLHYQPVLDLATSTVTGVEALVRWQRPGHGLIAPDEFIPVAETSDLVCDLGSWALLEAATQLAAWDLEGGELAGICAAVNVSGRHLSQPRLLGDVAAALAGSGIAPDRLTVEITETVLVDEPTAREHLRALRALGVKVALDDFGTGYTSIGQLSRLPVDVLKIDRSFVASRDRAQADLVRLVIGAAHSFSLGVVAEGVEDDAQLAALVAADCDAAQGFLFARPAPADELSVLAAAGRD